ncbi:MAG: PHP domain-containing protein, partial [Bacteroidota bacterium]
MPDFVHLHNHTHYSLLDAACKPEQLIEAAKADGQTALALTDHGVMFGCFEFY